MPDLANGTEYLLTLLCCALHDELPPHKPEGVTWSSVYGLAQRHSVSTLAFHAARRLPELEQWKGAAHWSEENAKLLVKSVNQSHALEQLCASFEAAQIPYAPLKGSCISDFFPETGTREMTDLDILIPHDSLEAADEIMRAAGYSSAPSADHHVEYLKPPYLVVELHTKLMSKGSALCSYYSDPWSRMANCGGYRYQMSCDDEYIFLLAHASKHYNFHGTGIRSVLDVYVYQRANREKMNRQYIAAELKKMKLTAFAEAIEELADAWFSDHPATLSRNAQKMSYYILNSSTYGTMEDFDKINVRRGMEKGKSAKSARVAYFFSMAFLPLDEMRYAYPVLNRAPILLPFCWIVRWIRILFCRPKSVIQQYRRIKNIRVFEDDEKASERKK